MVHSTMGWGWQQCQRVAVEMCTRVWRGWGGARHQCQQRLSAMLLQNPHEWAAHMIRQMQRLTRARQQLEQMGRVNCQIGDPTRIPSSEEQSLLAIERTRLGGSQLQQACTAVSNGTRWKLWHVLEVLSDALEGSRALIDALMRSRRRAACA